jgi:hypothetical protein
MFKLFTNRTKKERKNGSVQCGKLGPQNGVMLGFWEESGPKNNIVLGFWGEVVPKTASCWAFGGGGGTLEKNGVVYKHACQTPLKLP